MQTSTTQDNVEIPMHQALMSLFTMIGGICLSMLAFILLFQSVIALS